MIKNSLLRKAMEKNEIDFAQMYDSKNTAIMFAESTNVQQKLLKNSERKKIAFKKFGLY